MREERVNQIRASGRAAAAERADDLLYGQESFAAGARNSRLITVNARPSPITMDTTKTAVIVVDMQNDFVCRGGMFDRVGIDVSVIERVVPTIASVLAAARRAGVQIVFLKMGYRPDLSDLGPPGSPNRQAHLRIGVGKPERGPNGLESPTLIRDTWGTDIISALTPEPGDLVIYKHRFSGFYQTDLDASLRRLGVTCLIVTGCTTSVCVESTVRDAMFRDYSAVVLADCTAEPIGNEQARSNHDATLHTIESCMGWVSSSGDVLKALG